MKVMIKTNKYIIWGMTQSTLIHVFLMECCLDVSVPDILDGALRFHDQ